MVPKGHLIRLNSNRHLFTHAQASAEAREVDPGTRQTSLPPQGPCLPLRRPLPRPGKSILVPGQTSLPPQGPCLPLRRLQGTKQAPVYPCADCRSPNRRLFTVAQIA